MPKKTGHDKNMPNVKISWSQDRLRYCFGGNGKKRPKWVPSTYTIIPFIILAKFLSVIWNM